MGYNVYVYVCVCCRLLECVQSAKRANPRPLHRCKTRLYYGSYTSTGAHTTSMTSTHDHHPFTDPFGIHPCPTIPTTRSLPGTRFLFVTLSLPSTVVSLSARRPPDCDHINLKLPEDQRITNSLRYQFVTK